LKVTLTKLAQEAWLKIRRYLRRKFGPRVEMDIARQVNAARVAIAENPGHGHRIESTVFRDLRGIVVKKSLICYQVLPMHVCIVRILDVRQDVWTILKSPHASKPPIEPIDQVH
jgi:plasmid stabilization system protein ParE